MFSSIYDSVSEHCTPQGVVDDVASNTSASSSSHLHNHCRWVEKKYEGMTRWSDSHEDGEATHSMSSCNSSISLVNCGTLNGRSPPTHQPFRHRPHQLRHGFSIFCSGQTQKEDSIQLHSSCSTMPTNPSTLTSSGSAWEGAVVEAEL